MLLRTLTLAGGIAGAAGLSQFPEFSQQYVQRLGGAVDELTRVVEEFDADAAAVGLNREAGLQSLAEGGAMGAKRARTMAATVERHARLSADLAVLQGAGPFTRAYYAARLSDDGIGRAALSAYRPAMPLTFEGGVFAVVGLFGGMAAIGLALGLLQRLAAPFRRRKPVPT